VILETIRARKAFAKIAATDDAVFALDRAALVIGLEEYPDLDPEIYLRKLDTLAARAQVIIRRDRSAIEALNGLNQILFVEEGFRGNSEDYYDPRNSFLNEVLDRKLGIPISMSVLYMEVARRLGLPLEGVGLPGHFIVKHPYGLGRILSMKDCQELLDRVYGGNLTVQPAFLQAMDRKAIISRMLFNLKGIYYQKEEYQKALSIVERILILNPGLLSEIRDRGLLYMQTSLFAKALADLEHYLASATAPEDGAYIQNHVKTLRRIVSSPN